MIAYKEKCCVFFLLLVFFFFLIFKHIGETYPVEFSTTGQKGGKCHCSHFLLATVVRSGCVLLCRVWHSAVFLEIVGTLGMSLGISDTGAVSTFGVWHSLISSLSKLCEK